MRNCTCGGGYVDHTYFNALALATMLPTRLASTLATTLPFLSGFRTTTWSQLLGERQNFKFHMISYF
jgi:hypothetical protein